MTDYEAIKGKVDELLAAAAVKFEVVNTGVRTVKREKSEHSIGWPEYEQDAWRFTLTKYIGGNIKVEHSWSSDYFTGIGNRAPFRALGKRPPVNSIDWAKQEASRKPVKPRAADVLYCVLLDGQAADQSFHDWASDFGYDTDSLKALATYNACCESGRELRKLFTREEREALEELTREL